MMENASPDLIVAVIAGSATIFASVLALVISRHHQTKREQQIAHREKKVELYNEFLLKLFDLFAGEYKKTMDTTALVPFLREMHRNIILWAGPNVVISYSDWNQLLVKRPARAIHIIKMIDFFLALRQDLGHSNEGIQYEHLLGLLLKNPELFMREYTKNPDITLEELAKLEKGLGLLHDK